MVFLQPNIVAEISEIKYVCNLTEWRFGYVYFVIAQWDVSAKSLHLQFVDTAGENKSRKSGRPGD